MSLLPNACVCGSGGGTGIFLEAVRNMMENWVKEVTAGSNWLVTAQTGESKDVVVRGGTPGSGQVSTSATGFSPQYGFLRYFQF